VVLEPIAVLPRGLLSIVMYCLSVCSHISKTMSKSLLCVFTVIVARSSSGSVYLRFFYTLVYVVHHMYA